MAEREEALEVLRSALKMEKLAEKNCAEMLEQFKLNGFTEMVKHIENDEIHHQAMVEKLIRFLS